MALPLVARLTNHVGPLDSPPRGPEQPCSLRPPALPFSAAAECRSTAAFDMSGHCGRPHLLRSRREQGVSPGRLSHRESALSGCLATCELSMCDCARDQAAMLGPGTAATTAAAAGRRCRRRRRLRNSCSRLPTGASLLLPGVHLRVMGVAPQHQALPSALHGCVWGRLPAEHTIAACSCTDSFDLASFHRCACAMAAYATYARC